MIKMIKKIISVILVMLFLCPFVLGQETIQTDEDNSDKIDIYFFHGQGCPHCSKMDMRLKELEKEYPLNIIDYETYFDDKGRQMLVNLSKAYNVTISGVPTTFINNRVLVGAGNIELKQIEKEIQYCMEYKCVSPKDVLEGKVDINNIQFEKTTDGLGVWVFIGLILLFGLLIFMAYFITKKPKEKNRDNLKNNKTEKINYKIENIDNKNNKEKGDDEK